ECSKVPCQISRRAGLKWQQALRLITLLLPGVAPVCIGLVCLAGLAAFPAQAPEWPHNDEKKGRTNRTQQPPQGAEQTQAGAGADIGLGRRERNQQNGECETEFQRCAVTMGCVSIGHDITPGQWTGICGMSVIVALA